MSFYLCHFSITPRNSHAPAEGASLQRSAAQEARAGQADGPGGDRDLGGRGGAGPLGDQSLLREVGYYRVAEIENKHVTFDCLQHDCEQPVSDMFAHDPVFGYVVNCPTKYRQNMSDILCSVKKKKKKGFVSFTVSQWVFFVLFCFDVGWRRRRLRRQSRPR